MLRIMMAGGLALALSGCIEEEPAKTDGEEAAMSDPCGAEALAEYVGKPFDEGILPPGTRRVRVLHPDSIVTKDYRPDRLNIHLDDNDIVVRVACG